MYQYIPQEYFVDNPNSLSAKFYNQLKNKFFVNVEFEAIDPSCDVFSPGGTWYTQGRWLIKILHHNYFQLPRYGHLSFERILAHELLHVLLRYRNKLPWPDQLVINSTQTNIVNIIEHKIINPELDKAFGLRTNRKPNPLEQQLESYLNSINSSTTREEYIKILSNCLSAFKEKMPVFVIFP